MNSAGGAATQIYSPQFDRRFFAVPSEIQSRIQDRIDRVGLNLRRFPHYRMQGIDTYRVRAGDYRIIYQFSVEKNELHLIALGNRRDIYKKPFN